MKEKVIHFKDVEALPVEIGEKTTIRVLISKDDGAPTYSMRVFEVEPSGYIKEHSHPWEHEIFVLEGKGKIRIEDREYIVEPGYAIFIPPNFKHEYLNIGDKVWRFICTIPHV